MVATQFAPGRAVAGAILAILLLTLLPAPVAQAQTPAATNIGLVQGEAYWTQSTYGGGAKATSFLDNSTGESLLHVTVYNNGPAISNVPVYFYFTDVSHRSGCAKVSFAANSEVPLTFSVNTQELPPGGWNVTIEAFPAAKPDKVTSDCAAPVSYRATATDFLGRAADLDTSDNTAVAYFVKDRFLDLHIRALRWCEGTSIDNEDACDSNMLRSDNAPYNVTPVGDTSALTFVEAVVEALPGDNAWTDLHDYGGPNRGVGDGWIYDFNVTVRGPFISGAQNLTIFNMSTVNSSLTGILPGSDTHLARSQDFELNGRAGLYNITAKIDDDRRLRRHSADTVADTGRMDVEVAYRDFTANFTTTDFRTSSSNPYPYDGLRHIRGNITLRNDGPASVPTLSNGGAVNYTIYLDNLSWTEADGTVHANTLFRHPPNGGGKYTPTGPASQETIEIDWEYSSESTSSRYLPPGKHIIYAKMDTSDEFLEPNETNNTVALEIFIRDTSTPTFNATPKVVKQALGASINSPSQTTFKPLEPFNIYINVSDDDNQLKVVANFTLDSNASVYRTFNATKTPDRYVAQINRFNYHNFSNRSQPNGYENWTLRVVATDSFGNVATSTTQQFRLEPWPVHFVNETYLIVEPTWPNAQVSYDSTVEPRWKIRVEPNMTGYDGKEGRENQQFYTDNLGLNVSAPDKELRLNGSYWLARTSELCDTGAEEPTPNNPLPIPGNEVTGCPASEVPNNNTFTTEVAKRKPGGVGPGLWNYSVRVADIAGHWHTLNGTYLVLDEKPEILDGNLSTGLNGTVTPGASFQVKANVSDDDTLVGAWVNFTRQLDGLSVNFTLVNGTPVSVEGQPTTAYMVWNDTIQTGRGKMLGVGGNFTAVIHAVDGAGNWNHEEIGTILVQDTDIPEIDAGSFGVVPGAAEIGQNVTFWAKVRDSTNVTVELRIFRAAGSDEVLYEDIFLNESPDGNFTTTLNFSTEAVHGWELIPVDSVKNVGGKKNGVITVRDNLGPKYEVRSPEVVIDGTRYGSGTPRIEVIVFDVEGVVRSSIDMEVAGLPVDFDVLDAPSNINGYLVSYKIPANRKFDHMDVVEVNLSAQDNSSEQLLSYLNFSFVVDDVAPTARLISVSPAYRDQPAHVLNVSLGSRFTLAAEDVDQLPTDVGSIRYRILGGGPGGAETVYTGPFRIGDAPGVYTGPRLYQIQFYAEDAVGNRATTPNQTTVYVDDTPPALFQFFPQGRSVNATFVDDRVGVNRSVVWHRVNDAPYQPLALEERDGTWQTTLPAGVLGDRMSYYLQVWDKLDNTETYGNATNPYASFDVSNQEPELRIVTPVDGARVSRSVELTWEASDPDGQALVFTIFYKKPGTANFVELRKFEDTSRRAYTVDVSNSTAFPDGEYTFRVAAGDGGFVRLDEVTVTILKSTSAVGEVKVIGDAFPGETLLITAEVTKAQAIVEARLYLGDERVGPGYAMNDEGRDGDVVAGDNIFSVRVPIDAAGDYRVEIFTQYREDGVTKDFTMESAQTFTAKLTPGYVLSEYGAIIALIGLLAAVGIGVAVFVVMRRR